jgi:hypothetical protein
MDDDKAAFRQLNAAPDIIAQRFRATLLQLMRVISAQTFNSSALYEALAQWRSMLEGMRDCQEPLDWHDIFTQAVNSFESAVENDVDYAFREVARTGMSVYIDDMGRGGFGGKKFDRFLQAIERLERARTRSSEKRR